MSPRWTLNFVLCEKDKLCVREPKFCLLIFVLTKWVWSQNKPTCGWEQNYPPSLSVLSNYDFLIIFKGKFIGLGQGWCSLRVSYIFFFLISWVQCQAEPLFIFKMRNERTNCHDTPYCCCLIISIDNMNPSWCFGFY